MVTGFVLMAAAVAVAMLMRKKRWWLKTHRILGGIGTLSGILGLGAAIGMVAISTGQHFRGPHAYLGAMTILAVVLTPILGFLQFRIRKKQIRIVHRWSGRITIILVVVTIAAGLRLAGIL